MHPSSKQRRTGQLAGAIALLALLVTSCVEPGPTGTGVRSGSDEPRTSAVEPLAVQAQELGTAIRGHVMFPAARSTQAAPDYAAKNATLTLISLADNLSIVTGRTNADGTFVLSLNGFTPAAGSVYLLEASRGLDDNAAGNEVARFRTFLTWSGSAWTSISGATIAINAQTTAVAVVSSLDPINVPPSATMNKVTGTTVNAAPALTNHSVTEISTLAGEMLNYLVQDFDPVYNTPSIKPGITTLTPSNPTAGGAVVIKGSGFSPIQSSNVVLFGTATASIFTASAKTLGVFVPPGAPNSGVVTVKTALGTSPQAAAYTITASGGSGGSGGGGSAGGLSISELVPANGAPGDSIMIRGSGFSTVLAENVVKFAGIDAVVTYADTDTVVAKVPNGAASGPLTVTVAGVTKGFYFNFTVPIIASFTPNNGNELTSVTVNGQNFSSQGPQSKIRFNGVPSPNITSWFGTQAVGLAPPPTLTAKISGPVTVQSDAGIISQTGGPFTARQNVIENFSTTNQRNAGTNAAWGSNALQPAAAVTTFTQTNFSTNTNTNVGLTASNQLTQYPVIRHTGQIPGNSWCAQLGVDATSYFVNNNGTVYRYSLVDGSAMGTRTMVYQSSSASYLYLASENAYAEIGGNSASIYKFNAFAGAYTSSGYTHTGILASNGTHYLVNSNWGSYTIINTSFGAVANPFSVNYTNSAAGFTGSPNFLYKDSTAASITTLQKLTYPGSTTAVVNLPFAIGSTGLTSLGSPTIGSNGTNLFVLGSNASYNGGALSLFRFAFDGTTISLVSTAAGTSVTSAISLPANSIWDTLTFSRTVPTGATLTVDVLDGATNAVLLTNVSSGASLNGLTAASIKLRANLANAPTLTSWSVTTRPSYAISNGYDTGTNYGTYELPAITANNTSYAIQYSDSADNTAWGSWVSDITTLSRRYIRFKVNFSGSGTQITRVTLPYTY